jgi:calcineurin-like phosphoesterase family protein
VETKEVEDMRTFIISDLHLGHANIIKYCNRPFTSVEEMNATLVSNWNKTVGENDRVLFLGDLARSKSGYWIKQLNGRKTMIKGNHDLKGLPSKIITHNQEKLLLVHDPADIPNTWKGWVIHGHVHNNDLVNYPHINKEQKLVNVSCELVNYTPVNIDKLHGGDLNVSKKDSKGF